MQLTRLHIDPRVLTEDCTTRRERCKEAPDAIARKTLMLLDEVRQAALCCDPSRRANMTNQQELTHTYD